jgi:hypothetical protein
MLRDAKDYIVAAAIGRGVALTKPSLKNPGGKAIRRRRSPGAPPPGTRVSCVECAVRFWPPYYGANRCETCVPGYYVLDVSDPRYEPRGKKLRDVGPPPPSLAEMEAIAAAEAQAEPEVAAPCATCVHSTPYAEAYTGYMCSRNASACVPFGAAHLYERRTAK